MLPEAITLSDEVHTLRELTLLLGSDGILPGYRVAATSDHFAELCKDDLSIVVADASLFGDGEPWRAAQGPGPRAHALWFCVGSPGELGGLAELHSGPPWVAFVPLPSAASYCTASIAAAAQLWERLQAAELRGRSAEQYRYELSELFEISTSLNSELDLHRLLGLILTKSRYVTSADAGSIYVVASDGAHPDGRVLRFEVAQNDSMSLDLSTFTLRITERSIVGATVLRNQVINIPDLYELGRHNPWGVAHDQSFDARTGYQTRSLLSVPLANNRNEVLGVLQLINRKREPGAPLRTADDFARVIPFDAHAVELCQMLASQAGIALENALLYGELQRVFEGFVDASVEAIEARDPTTSGHSRRVASLTVGLAEAVNRLDTGPYAETSFAEDQLKAIEYAGLLHDFGKIGVPEAVLVKSNKLYGWQREIILLRFDNIQQCLAASHARDKLDLAQRGGLDAAAHEALDARLTGELGHLELCRAAVLAADSPSLLDQDQPRVLQEIAEQTYVDVRGNRRRYLEPEELACLNILRGSLSAEERAQIQSHVEHTFNYLCKIPWGRRFREIPLIAGAHHEKLDGTGYPAGKHSDEIPVQAKMMTIADIFDALTAADRPYKRAVPCERALDILSHDVKLGKLDPHLFQVFVDARIYTRVV